MGASPLDAAPDADAALGRGGLNITLPPLEMSDAIIRDQAYKEGMKPLRVSGAAKIDAGSTTVDEVVKVVPLA